MTSPAAARTPRTVFLSDVHLGTRACKAEFLLDFLVAHEPETLYLVGDIVDVWALRRSWYWDDAHDAVLREILRKARSGTRVVFVPGNHDEVFRGFLGAHGPVEILGEAVHVTADGRRLLVIHGDDHDAVVRGARWLAHVGDAGYAAAVTLNHWLNVVRRLAGRPYWSLAGFLKREVKEALAYVDGFELSVLRRAAARGFDGVVCGHVHSPCIREIDGLTYHNDGDWVDSCTALVEHADGRIELVDWMQERMMLLHAGQVWPVALHGANGPAPLRLTPGQDPAGAPPAR